MIWDIFLEALEGAVEVSLYVTVMMILIEALNIESRGRIFKKMGNSGAGQVGVASLLGAIPGCVGGFAVSSLYNHGMLSIGALLAMMIATFGDETMAMLALFPKTTVPIIFGLCALGFVSGLVADAISRKKAGTTEHCHALEVEENTGKRSFRQFLKEDVLHHVLMHHIPKIFAWTFGVLFVMGLLQHYIDIESWIGGNTALMIIIAALVGLIPQSGPHLIFVTLFASGTITLPVLLASCISQNGHASLPLLAENRRAFIITKLTTCLLGMAVGFISLLFVR